MPDNLSDVSPGKKLQTLLMEIFPLSVENRKSFVSRIDDALIAEGDFAKLVYDSSINYLLRRLVTTAEYLKRKYTPSDYPSERYIVEIRRFVRDNIHIPFDQVEKVVAVLLECLEKRNKIPTQTTKNRIRRVTREKGLRCYICGCEMNFEEDGQYNSVEVEHIWPRTMGGHNDDANLKASCRQCNHSKEDYIDATDFHYEEISLVSDKLDDDFSKELKWDYKVALWAKSDFRCVECGKSACTGQLQFARRNTGDSWHFLNIDAYCDQHIY